MSASIFLLYKETTTHEEVMGEMWWPDKVAYIRKRQNISEFIIGNVEATNKVENSVGLFDLVQYKKPRLFGENNCASLLSAYIAKKEQKAIPSLWTFNCPTTEGLSR